MKKLLLLLMMTAFISCDKPNDLEVIITPIDIELGTGGFAIQDSWVLNRTNAGKSSKSSSAKTESDFDHIYFWSGEIWVEDLGGNEVTERFEFRSPTGAAAAGGTAWDISGFSYELESGDYNVRIRTKTTSENAFKIGDKLVFDTTQAFSVVAGDNSPVDVALTYPVFLITVALPVGAEDLFEAPIVRGRYDSGTTYSRELYKSGDLYYIYLGLTDVIGIRLQRTGDEYADSDLSGTDFQLSQHYAYTVTSAQTGTGSSTIGLGSIPKNEGSLGDPSGKNN